METKNYDSYVVPGALTNRANYIHAVQCMKDIILIPVYAPSVIKFNLDTRNFDTVLDGSIITEYTLDYSSNLFWRGACVANEILVLARFTTPEVFLINLLTNEINKYKVGYEDGGTSSCFYIENKYIFVGQYGEVCILDNNFKMIRKMLIEKRPADMHPLFAMFDNAIINNGVLFMVGCNNQKIYRMDLDFRKVISNKINADVKKYESLWCDFMDLKINSEGLLETFSLWDGKQYEINPVTLEIVSSSDKNKIGNDSLKRWIRDTYTESNVHAENSIIGIKEFVEHVTSN